MEQEQKEREMIYRRLPGWTINQAFILVDACSDLS
jgi:hypothetical protein